MDAYIESLPNGLASYPGCQQKAQVVRQFLPLTERRKLEGLGPPEITAIIDEPPPATAWVPEVHATAIYLALRDTMKSDDEFIDYAREMNRSLVSSPMYRILFAFVSPERVVRGAASRWGQMHRGTELHPRRVSTNDAVFRLTTPPNAVPEILARAYSTAYQTAVELSGGSNVTCQVAEGGPTGWTFNLKWT